jgi:hypothetical protein
LQAFGDRGYRSIVAAVGVGVFQAKDQLAAGLLGIEPVEKGGAGVADMQVAGRRRGETDSGAQANSSV